MSLLQFLGAQPPPLQRSEAVTGPDFFAHPGVNRRVGQRHRSLGSQRSTVAQFNRGEEKAFWNVPIAWHLEPEPPLPVHSRSFVGGRACVGAVDEDTAAVPRCTRS